MTDAERLIVSKLKRYIQSIVDYRIVYVDKRRFQNLIRLKFYGYSTSYNNIELFKKCEEIVHTLYQENSAYFLKPVIDERFYRTYNAEYMVPCLIFFFNV